jgi:3-methyladenine DNA glycosylase AlkD
VGADRRAAAGPGAPPAQRGRGDRLTAGPAGLDLAAEAAAVTATLRALAPTPTSVPVIKTSRPFYGAPVGDLRGTARAWLRRHRRAAPAEVADLADRLWNAGIREEQLVACFLLAGRPAALDATTPARVWAWTALLDNWETTDQLAMNVLGPLVALDPAGRFGELEAMAADPHPWTRRLALAAATRLARGAGAAALWPRVGGLLLAVAGDREAALPKAVSWVLRSWLEPCPAEVAAFVDRHADRLPALAVRETRSKLTTGYKR